MKFSSIFVVAIASVAIAAPVPEAKSEAAGYGDYPAPKGGYGNYGTYGAVTPTAPVTPPTGGYGSYGTYAPPTGGYGKYGSYGTYKRVIEDLVKRVLG